MRHPFTIEVKPQASGPETSSATGWSPASTAYGPDSVVRLPLPGSFDLLGDRRKQPG